MLKKLLLSLLFTVSLFGTNFLQNKISNLIGEDKYKKHSKLLDVLFEDDFSFYKHGSIDYTRVLAILKEYGLLSFQLKQPKEITYQFNTTSAPLKSLKILKDILRSIGYSFYMTKSLVFDGNKSLSWVITVRTEYLFDSYIFSKELNIYNASVTNITKTSENSWLFDIKTNSSFLQTATEVDINESYKLRKPLVPYMINLIQKSSTKINIVSKRNHWYPYITFFDDNLGVLKIIKKDKIIKNMTTSIPYGTKYIKINDLYTLLNIKNGITVTIK